MKQPARQRLSRREEVLAAASLVMRRHGVPGTRLQQVADQLGVAHPALYRYFSGRDDMVGEAVRWNIEIRAREIDAASGETALDRLLDFFASGVMVDREFKIPLPHFASMSPASADRARTAYQQLAESVTALIERGMAEGAVRPCHAPTIARVLLWDIDYFTQLDLAGLDPSQESAASVVDHLCGLLRRGILRERSALPESDRTIDDGQDLLLLRPAGDEESAKFDAILRTATRHFNREGAEASVRRIAAELGMSKTVVYNFAADKQELMHLCLTRAVDAIEISHRIADERGRDPLERMTLHRKNLYIYHASAAGPFAGFRSADFLKPQHRRIVRMKNKQVRETSIQRLQAAIAHKHVRADVNPWIAQRLLGHAIYALPHWHDEAWPLDINEASREIQALHYQGLAP